VLRGFIANGGKRLRPEFAYWSFVGCGGDPDDPALLDLACALEMLHTFALIHDDVMDGSAVRRHAPTVHHALMETHQQGLWRGEPRRFAEGMAVLLGDLAFVYAGRFCSDLPAAVRQCFHEMAVELHVGQYLDLLGAAQANGVERAALVTRYKTAKYSVERPLLLGALLANGADLDAGAAADNGNGLAGSRDAALSCYGLAVGEAFQLRDDLLGAFGDPALTGKPIGDDFREGKQTLLMQHARRWVESRNGQGHADRGLLQQFDRAAIDEAGVAALQDLLRRSGACEAVEARIDVLTRTAQAELRRAALSTCAEVALHHLAGRAAWRVS
jgi:geranylgeranyl diphosphate synthase, type I